MSNKQEAEAPRPFMTWPAQFPDNPRHLAADAVKSTGMDDEQLIGVVAAAHIARIAPSSWRTYVARGRAPKPDAPRDANGRPRWKKTTVEAWQEQKPGQGHRSDLDGSTRRAADQRERERTTTTPTSAEQTAWLTQHHQALLQVADRLVDARDELLDQTPTVATELAAAIDQAGAAMDRTPSRALASAVAYALFLLRGRQEDSELARWLATQWPLHQGWAQIRGPAR